MAIAAPVIEAEMADWVALGGGNSGIVGDPRHTYGFHLAANEVGPGDYSRWRDPNGSDGPYVNWSYACAGDFRHGGDERLRAMHRRVLARLMDGDLPMICEFIGKPWADRPVYYWARWNGIGTLQRYTGAGHDLWSHISWYRSRANERAYLWTPAQEDDMPIYARTEADATVWVSDGLRRRPIRSEAGIVGGFDAVRMVKDEAALTDLCGPPDVAAAVSVDVAKLAADLAKRLPAPGGDLSPELVETLSKARDALDAVVAAAQRG